MNYILAIDQSTQGTKAMILDDNGTFLLRRDLPHKQLINKEGWVGHDAEEIANNIFKVCYKVIEDSGIEREKIVGIAVTNQRESVAVWERSSGKPVCESIVWQCNRAAKLCEKLSTLENKKMIYEKSGLQFSPFFSGPKITWVFENIAGVKEKAERGEICIGNMDTWTIWQLTDGKMHKTDISNANRTQLFNIRTQNWDEDLCKFYGVPMSCLPEICDSDAYYGETDLKGFLPHKIPIHAAIGDSNAVLFSHGCTNIGDVMCGYGTGTSVMMNTGSEPIFTNIGVNSTVAWRVNGNTFFALEGVVNYSGAVVTWLKNNAHLIDNPIQSAKLAEMADPSDKTYMVPAFTGIGAPHWKSDATAAYLGMTRKTGQAELVRAALQSIAYQVSDLIYGFENQTCIVPHEIRVAGGPTNNKYLMQFQSDIVGCPVVVSEHEELSGIGSAYIAGIAMGIYDYEELMKKQKVIIYKVKMDDIERSEKLKGWKHALKIALMY